MAFATNAGGGAAAPISAPAKLVLLSAALLLLALQPGCGAVSHASSGTLHEAFPFIAYGGSAERPSVLATR